MNDDLIARAEAFEAFLRYDGRFDPAVIGQLRARVRELEEALRACIAADEMAADGHPCEEAARALAITEARAALREDETR